jgi:nucleoside-diphosphate-sugar epimerase
MDLQVIFGTGPVGLNTAQALLEQGMNIRFVNRSGSLSEQRKLVVPALKEGNWEIQKADATVWEQVQKAVEGASHIYHCANPLYHQWSTILRKVQENLIQAALEQNAVLAVSENLYMYKRGVDTIQIDTEIDPPTKKGLIRQALHEKLIQAGKENSLKWTTIRASDFYGPGSTDQSVFGTKYFLNSLFNSKKVYFMGNASISHSYTYVKDFGKALALAAHDKDAWQKSWIIANKEIHTKYIAQKFMYQAGKQVGMGKLSRRLLSFLGIFNPVIREVPEMLYQKEEDYIVDGSDFEKKFNFRPTSLNDGIAETLQWYNSYRNILLKPIEAPKMNQFDKLIALGDKAGIELNLKEGDVEQAIKNVRKGKNAHSS